MIIFPTVLTDFTLCLKISVFTATHDVTLYTLLSQTSCTLKHWVPQRYKTKVPLSDETSGILKHRHGIKFSRSDLLLPLQLNNAFMEIP